MTDAIEAIGAALPRRSLDGRTSAAVALILRPARELELLFIRRPVRSGDRWSGDVAFPGGLARPGERAIDAARREAREEVGLALGAPLGRLRDRVSVHPRSWRPMRVRPYVFVATPGSLALDPREVDEAFFFPVERLLRLSIRRSHRRIAGLPVWVPALVLDGRTLWGLTLSMVRELRAIILSARARSGRL